MEQVLTTKHDNNPFATQPIGKLIARFAIPCVISLLVNSLYNIVDQIFIGHGVGYLGNGATNVVFPITVITLAFALLIGDGGAAFLSLKLGQSDAKAAQKGVGNAIVMVTIAGVLLAAACVVFMRPLLYVFGVTDNLLAYALDYGYIIAIGLPFAAISTALNSIIRADGSPKFAMMSMLLGAAINIVLDPIFIFPLQMGVKGAAIATVAGQIASFIVSAVYVAHFKSVKVNRFALKLDRKVCANVLSLGVSSFITQLSIVVVMAVTNNLLVKYGALSVYGAEIPMTAMGITMKVNQIMISIIVGIAAGAQPIIGYNYGAGNTARVKKTFLISIAAAGAVTVIAFLIFQLYPMGIISMFGSEQGLYNEFAIKCFKIFLMLCVLSGFQTVASIFLQAIGKPIKAAVVSLSRQIIILIPAAVILPMFVGVEGVLWAGPVADCLSFVLAFVLIGIEMRSLSAGTVKRAAELASA